jgi:hypothetical protein
MGRRTTATEHNATLFFARTHNHRNGLLFIARFTFETDAVNQLKRYHAPLIANIYFEI